MEGFVLASLAPMFAVVFTNPFDVAKVGLFLGALRISSNCFQVLLQLQTNNPGGPRIYNGMLDAIAKVHLFSG